MGLNGVPFVSRRQQTFLKQLRRLGTLNDTPDRVPMKLVFVLCRFHFNCTEYRVLMGLRLDGFLDFEGFDSDCVIVRLPWKSEVVEASPKANPLPFEDSLERLVRRYHRNAGRVVIEQNERSEDEGEGVDLLCRYPRRKPTDEELLADFVVLEDASEQLLTSALSMLLVRWHWPREVQPANHRVRLKARGYLAFDKNAGLWSVTESGRAAVQNVEPTLTLEQAEELVRRSALCKRAPRKQAATKP